MQEAGTTIHNMNENVEQPKWAHSADLRQIRGPLSVEKAARRIDVTRQTWHAWEQGGEPSYDNLRAIVEEFGVPPEMVGFEPPRGYELVPSAWIQREFSEIREGLSALQATADGISRRVS